MTDIFKTKDRLTFRWCSTNLVVFAIAVAGSCYQYRPAANFTVFLIAAITFVSVVSSFWSGATLGRLNLRKENQPPATIEAVYDFTLLTLLASHGWFWSAGFYAIHMIADYIIRHQRGKPVTASDRGKAVLTFYASHVPAIEEAERLPYVLADLEISEGDEFMPALQRSYRYAATERDEQAK